VPIAWGCDDEAINIVPSEQVTVVENSLVTQSLWTVLLRFLDDSDSPVAVLLVDVTNSNNFRVSLRREIPRPPTPMKAQRSSLA
jgi:hypothetical protein